MKYLMTLFFLLITNIAFCQDDCAECDKFKIVGVYDFGPPPGGNWVILLLTVTEDLDSGFDPHYSDLFFMSSNGDTITNSIGMSHTLPQVKSDTIPYLLELKTNESNQNFPPSFDGKLVVTTITSGSCPDVTRCDIAYSTITVSIVEEQFSRMLSTVYPNPTTNEIRINTKKPILIVNIYNELGELLKTKTHYKNADKIDLEGIESEMMLIQLIHDDKIEIHRVLKTE